MKKTDILAVITAAVAAIAVFTAFAQITPQTAWWEVSPTNTLADVAAGAGLATTGEVARKLDIVHPKADGGLWVEEENEGGGANISIVDKDYGYEFALWWDPVNGPLILYADGNNYSEYRFGRPGVEDEVAVLGDIPTNYLHESYEYLTNSAAFKQAVTEVSPTETDPTVPAWAKAPSAPLPPDYVAVSNAAKSAATPQQLAAKQDKLPYATNAIPQGAVSDLSTALASKLDKTGGTIAGDVEVVGRFVVTTPDMDDHIEIMDIAGSPGIGVGNGLYEFPHKAGLQTFAVLSDIPNISGKADKADVAAAATAATNYTDFAIGAAIANTNPTFSNAVLSVGLGIDTNAVAAINALVEAGDELPIGGAATVGGLLLALAAAVAALKRKKPHALTLGSGNDATDYDGSAAVSLVPGQNVTMTKSGNTVTLNAGGSGKLLNIVLPLTTNYRGVIYSTVTITLDSGDVFVFKPGTSSSYMTVEMNGAELYGLPLYSAKFYRGDSDVHDYPWEYYASISLWCNTARVQFSRYDSIAASVILNGVSQSITTNNVDITLTMNKDSNFLRIFNLFCLAYGTQIELADGSFRAVEDIRVGDKVLALDENGNEVEDVVTECTGEAGLVGAASDIWKFDDGTEVTTVGRHRFYNADLGEFMYLEAWNMGEHARLAGGRLVALVGHERVEGETKHATLFTERYNTYFANGMLCGNRRSVKVK